MIEIGAPLPDVTVIKDGEARQLTDLMAAPTLLIFFKRACATCQLSLPVFNRWTAYAPSVRLLGISQDSPEETAAFFAEYGLDMPVVYDPPPYEASSTFGLVSVPTLVLAEDGGVTWTSEGWQTAAAQELSLTLAALAGKEPIFTGMDAMPAWKPG